MKLETRATVSVAAALLYLSAQNAVHAQTTQFLPNNSATVAEAPAQSPATPTTSTANAIGAQAAVAALRDTDPKINGSVGDAPAKPASK